MNTKISNDKHSEPAEGTTDMSDTPSKPSDTASSAQACSLDGMVSLHDCLREINHALNYWYPLKHEASLEERNARHVRLFQFRDRLERELKANAEARNGPK